MELRSCNLKTSTVEWQGSCVAQKSGVCSGSMKPVHSSNFLARIDRALEQALTGMVLKTLRHVDDFLAFIRNRDVTRMAVEVTEVFRERALRLRFTFEMPSSNQLQFLDLSLQVVKNLACMLCKARW